MKTSGRLAVGKLGEKVKKLFSDPKNTTKTYKKSQPNVQSLDFFPGSCASIIRGEKAFKNLADQMVFVLHPQQMSGRIFQILYPFKFPPGTFLLRRKRFRILSAGLPDAPRKLRGFVAKVQSTEPPTVLSVWVRRSPRGTSRGRRPSWTLETILTTRTPPDGPSSTSPLTPRTVAPPSPQRPSHQSS